MSGKFRSAKRGQPKEAEEDQIAAADIADMGIEEMRKALTAERNKSKALEANEKSRFGAEEAYLGTGEINGANTYDATNGNAEQDNNDEGNGDNSLHGAMRINAIRAYDSCDRESCGEKSCPSHHHYNQALMEWLTTAVVADGEPRRTYKNDMAEVYQAMNRELQKGEEMLLDSGSNIHLLTLQHARRYFASQRSTRMTVLGISGVRDRCSAEGEVILLVKDNNGKQLRLSLGLGYSSSSVPKSLLSAARLMEDGAILHFEKGNSYIEFPNQGQRIPLIERGGLFYVPAVNIGIADGEMDSPKYAAQGSSKGAPFLGFASEVDAKEACASYAADAKGEKEANQAFAGGGIRHTRRMARQVWAHAADDAPEENCKPKHGTRASSERKDTQHGMRLCYVSTG